MEIKTFGVIGAGQMGNGIAHVFAQSGHDVVMMDRSADALERALATIGKNMDRMVAKEKISAADKDAALAEVFRILKPGGRLANACAQDIAHEDFVDSVCSQAGLLQGRDDGGSPKVDGSDFAEGALKRAKRGSLGGTDENGCWQCHSARSLVPNGRFDKHKLPRDLGLRDAGLRGARKCGLSSGEAGGCSGRSFSLGHDENVGKEFCSGWCDTVRH